MFPSNQCYCMGLTLSAQAAIRRLDNIPLKKLLLFEFLDVTSFQDQMTSISASASTSISKFSFPSSLMSCASSSPSLSNRL